MNYSTDVVILPDIHEPWGSKRGKKLAVEFIGDTKPKKVVQIGDLYDQLSASRHPHSLNNLTPSQEAILARLAAEELWAAVHKVSPSTKKYQIMGNHDGRTAKRVLDKLPEVEHLVLPALKNLYTFANVKTVHSEWDELILDGVVFQHGFKKFGDHARWNNMPTVIGHLHVGMMKWFPSKKNDLWELCCGHLGEIDSPAFGYRNQKTIHGWNLGIGVIDSHGPRFVGF